MPIASGLGRRDFLRLAGGAALAAAGFSCGGSGDDEPKAAPRTKGSGPGGGERTLRIAQSTHFVPSYEQWFDNEYARRWGEDHDVKIVVEHFPYESVGSRASAEVAAQGPHDIFGFVDTPPAFEDEVIDHRELIEEVEAKLGQMTPLLERSTLSAKTRKYFGFPEYWSANLANYRADLWDQVEAGLRPSSWDDVLRAAPKLKAMGHPVGIGMSNEGDSFYALASLMHAYGSSIQDGEANVAINRPATVEAVKMGAAIFQGGMTDEVLIWDPSSNNRFLASGKGSMILNAVSALRAAESQDPALARQILLAPTPTAHSGLERPRGVYVTAVNVIWRFSKNQEVAKQFLVDLALDYREAFIRSRFYNFPAFPGVVPDLGELVARDPGADPSGKYAFLGDVVTSSTNIGHPGHANAAVEEVMNQFIIQKMFAAAGRGDMSAEEAVKAAEAQIKPIFEKWREQGKI
ncbi:MAG: ABC transporter substrate-binding protein [Gaiellales bacterium]